VTSISKNTTLDHEIKPIYVNAHDGEHRFNHAVEIRKPSGMLDIILEWCKSEMQDKTWRWQLLLVSSPYSF